MSRHDPYLLILDLEAYIACQNQVNDGFLDTATWTRKAILNVARMGKFSSDRAIGEYCRKVWKTTPLAVDPSRDQGTPEGR